MYSQHDIEKIKELILNHFENEVEIILFGSYAKGNSNSESDIDFAVLTDSKFDRQYKLKILSTIRWAAAKLGYNIDIILKNRDDFINESQLPTLSNIIKREGISI